MNQKRTLMEKAVCGSGCAKGKRKPGPPAWHSPAAHRPHLPPASDPLNLCGPRSHTPGPACTPRCPRHKHVLLVEEEHDGRRGEVAVVTDAVEQVQAFVHAVLGRAAAVGHRRTRAAAPEKPTPSSRAPRQLGLPAHARRLCLALTTSSSSTSTMS